MVVRYLGLARTTAARYCGLTGTMGRHCVLAWTIARHRGLARTLARCCDLAPRVDDAKALRPHKDGDKVPQPQDNEVLRPCADVGKALRPHADKDAARQGDHGSHQVARQAPLSRVDPRGNMCSAGPRTRFVTDPAPPAAIRFHAGTDKLPKLNPMCEAACCTLPLASPPPLID